MGEKESLNSISQFSEDYWNIEFSDCRMVSQCRSDHRTSLMNMPRRLKPEEVTLITIMLRTSPKGNELLPLKAECLVEEMQDGNMGSLKFVGIKSQDRRFGEEIAEAEFLDEDGVLVSATINVDNAGDLFELDLWKVDFSPLIRHPKADDITIKTNDPKRYIRT